MKLKDMKVGEVYAISTDRDYLDSSWHDPAQAILLDDRVWHEGYHGWRSRETKTVVLNGVEYKGVPDYIGPGGVAGDKNGCLMLLIEGSYGYNSSRTTPQVIMGMHVKGLWSECKTKLDERRKWKDESYRKAQEKLAEQQERAEALWDLFAEKGVDLGYLSKYGKPEATFDVDELEDLYAKLTA